MADSGLSLKSCAKLAAAAVRRRGWLPVVALFLLVLIFVAPALLPGKVLMPLDIVAEAWSPWRRPNQPVNVHNDMLTDVALYIFPVKQFMSQTLRSGVFPLWNPYVFAGYPFTYNTQAGVFYPFSILYYLLPATSAVDLTIILQMGLGAVFMYAYLRIVRLKRLASLAGAIIFTFNGLMVVWLEWQVVHAAIIWLPLQLYLVERMSRLMAKGANPWPDATMVYAVLLGMASAMPWLGGHWNWALYTSMVLGAYLFFRVAPWLLRKRSSRPRKQVIMASITAILVGIGLSLIQVLPAVNYLSQSHRRPLPFSESLNNGLLDRFVALLVPDFFGDPVHENWWGPGNYAETTLYLGMLPLLLAGIALWLRRDRVTLFFTAVGAMGLLWTLGTPAYRLLHILPVFNGLYPSRAAILVTLSVGVLSSLSMDRLLTTASRDRRRVSIFAFSLMFIMLALTAIYLLYYRYDAGRNLSYLRPQLAIFILLLISAVILLLTRLHERISPLLFGLVSVSFITADLFAFGIGYNTISSTANLYPHTATADFLHQDQEIYRIATPAQGLAYPPNSSIIERLANVSGYEPGILQRTFDFLNAAEGGSVVYFTRALLPLKGLDSPLLDLLNVKYIVTTSDFWGETPELDVLQDRQEDWIPLISGSRVSQGFTASDAGLHRLDLMLDAKNEPVGLVTVRIFTADGQQELAHDARDVSEIQSAQWYPFYFSAFPSEWGRSFLATTEFGGEGGEMYLGMVGKDAYPDGEAEQAGARMGGDLAFATYHLPRPDLVFEEGTARIYLNRGYFQRAFVVPEAVVAESAEAALSAVVARQSRLAEVAVLELEGQPAPVDLGGGSAPPGRVNITEYGLNEVILAAEMDAPGYVVLADTYYPGWRATIDGRPSPVYRANYILRAVYVPAGQHVINFSFWPGDFIVGAAISGSTLIGSLLLLIVTWRHRKSAGSALL